MPAQVEAPTYLLTHLLVAMQTNLAIVVMLLFGVAGGALFGYQPAREGLSTMLTVQFLWADIILTTVGSSASHSARTPHCSRALFSRWRVCIVCGAGRLAHRHTQRDGDAADRQPLRGRPPAAIPLDPLRRDAPLRYRVGYHHGRGRRRAERSSRSVTSV